ncbi:MAG: hypothetical protein KHY88_10580 [Erysipelotrichaceae bacterium]|nr:hypothetical protein [Erysipelotrichaceae bacterium]
MEMKKMTSSQQSIYNHNMLYKKQKYNSAYTNMFYQDFCSHLSIALKNKRDYRNFYKIKSNENLEELLEYNDYNFLEYDFDELLRNNLLSLIHSGKEFIEIVRWYDENKLVKISFMPFKNLIQIHLFNYYFYLTKTNESKFRIGKINANDVIKMNVKEMGFSKRYFKRLFKKLRKLDYSNTDLSLILDKNSGYDTEVDKRKKEYIFLKECKKIRWLGRNYDNYYASQPYLLFVRMEEVKLKENILTYLLKKYNERLNSIGDIYGFSGELYFDNKSVNYRKLLKELYEGTKTCEEVSKVFFD